MWTILAGHINQSLRFAGKERVAGAQALLRPISLHPHTPKADLLALAKLLPLLEVLEHASRFWTEELAVAVAVTDVAKLEAPAVGLFPIFSLLPCLFLSEQFIFFFFLFYGY